MTSDCDCPTCFAYVLATNNAQACGKYLGDNDGTCPQLTCVRRKNHDGLCDNVRGDESCTR